MFFILINSELDFGLKKNKKTKIKKKWKEVNNNKDTPKYKIKTPAFYFRD
jgi:hypothetical protein